MDYEFVTSPEYDIIVVPGYIFQLWNETIAKSKEIEEEGEQILVIDVMTNELPDGQPDVQNPVLLTFAVTPLVLKLWLKFCDSHKELLPYSNPKKGK